MPFDINKVCLHGRCGQDADVRFFESGRVKTAVSIAVYQGKDKAPAWVDIELWGDDPLDNPPVKGQRVYVEGRIKVDTWQAKDGGGNRSKLLILADKIDDAPLNGSTSQQGQSQSPQQRVEHRVNQPAQTVNYDAF